MTNSLMTRRTYNFSALLTTASLFAGCTAPRSDKEAGIQGYPFEGKVRDFDEACEKCLPSEKWSSVSSLVHSILLWGNRCYLMIDDEAVGLLSVLTQHPTFEKYFGQRSPLLASTRYGARFFGNTWTTSNEENQSREAHAGQVLAVLAECGVPLTQKIQTSDGLNLSLRSVLDDAKANFSMDTEIEWITAAVALYDSQQPIWSNRFGENISLDRLANALANRELTRSACAGTHTLYTLAVLLQANDHSHFLSSRSKNRIQEFLARARDALEATQAEDGSWSYFWDPGLARYRRFENRHEHVWITGHHLDWQAIVPPTLRVANERLGWAARYVCRQTALATREEVLAGCCEFFHGVRATSRLLATPLNQSVFQVKQKGSINSK
jgi:hypothetical protein